MRFKDVFSIIGPVMVGPSSSHTAGAVSIGRVARQLLGRVPSEADIALYGSFAETYRGHGTDVALVAGLLDWSTEDMRIPRSLEFAAEVGMRVNFRRGAGTVPHPNTALIRLQCGPHRAEVLASSIGGGNIEVHRVNGFAVRCSAAYPALFVSHRDVPGVIAAVTRLLSAEGVNIVSMSVDRKGRSGEALSVIETDENVHDALLAALRALPDVSEIRKIDVTGSRCA